MLMTTFSFENGRQYENQSLKEIMTIKTKLQVSFEQFGCAKIDGACLHKRTRVPIQI